MTSHVESSREPGGSTDIIQASATLYSDITLSNPVLEFNRFIPDVYSQLDVDLSFDITQIILVRMVPANTGPAATPASYTFSIQFISKTSTVSPIGRFLGQPGPTGVMGFVGVFGYSGSVASPSPTGPFGYIGFLGLKGPPGPTGPVGPQGAGDPGPVGPQGPVGPFGPQGATGVVGAVGPTGPAGSQGSTGPFGPTGPAGGSGDDPLRPRATDVLVTTDTAVHEMTGLAMPIPLEATTEVSVLVSARDLAFPAGTAGAVFYRHKVILQYSDASSELPYSAPQDNETAGTTWTVTIDRSGGFIVVLVQSPGGGSVRWTGEIQLTIGYHA
jgi:hypothetical protein